MEEVLLTILRDRTTPRDLFRKTTEQLSYLLAARTMALLPKKTTPIQTPIASTDGVFITQKMVLVVILRAGLSLLPGFLNFFCNSTVGFIGLKRDEKTAQAHQYYYNLPQINRHDYVIILDPTVATGGSLIAAIELLQQKGVVQKQIIFVGILSSTEGLNRVKKTFPGLSIIMVAQDQALNSQKLIVPGFGDFGDRYFGTE